MKDEKATFAAGCFWGVQSAFDELEGVIETKVGYTGGNKENPAYEEVCNEETGHAEAIQIIFNPEKISYEELLDKFWEIHDPTQLNRQGLDIGTNYRSAIFFHSEKQKELALKSKKEIAEKRNIKEEKIMTEIVPAKTFYMAEEYHQKYMEKHKEAVC